MELTLESIIIKRGGYYDGCQKFFESLSDEEFVRMMIECGIKSSKKPEESDYIKAFYPNYMK